MTENWKKFGTLVRSRRQKEGLGVREVARRVKMDPTYLSKVERGHNPPPAADKIEAIARVLNTDPDELVALAGRVPTDVETISEKHPAAAAELLRWASDEENRQLLKAWRERIETEWSSSDEKPGDLQLSLIKSLADTDTRAQLEKLREMFARVLAVGEGAEPNGPKIPPSKSARARK